MYRSDRISVAFKRTVRGFGPFQRENARNILVLSLSLARERHCPGTDPLWGGDWGGHCNSLLGLKLCNPFFLHFSGQYWQCLAPT